MCNIINPASWTNCHTLRWEKDSIFEQIEMICRCLFSVMKYFFWLESIFKPKPTITESVLPTPWHFDSCTIYPCSWRKVLSRRLSSLARHWGLFPPIISSQKDISLRPSLSSLSTTGVRTRSKSHGLNETPKGNICQQQKFPSQKNPRNLWKFESISMW